MSIFSKLFSSASVKEAPLSRTIITEALEKEFEDGAEFYTRVLLFYQGQKKIIEYMMIHPRIGVILFNFFDYSPQELRGVTASAANADEKNADIRVRSDKGFLESRFDEASISRTTPVHSVLICTQLSEDDFDHLDRSFHELMPKPLILFRDTLDSHKKLSDLADENCSVETNRVKQALFSEFILPKTGELISSGQQGFIHSDLHGDLLLQGLPGSGKSSLLIAKALYELMKTPKLRLIVLAPRPCNVHLLQSLIFKCIENSGWGLNPADITVSSFESIHRRSREKERYDLVVCDDINQEDLAALQSLLDKEGHLLCASHHSIDKLPSYKLTQSFRLSPALCAACEGREIDQLGKELVFRHGNIHMNVLLILEGLLKEAHPNEITIFYHDKEKRRELQSEINEYFTPISYLFDDSDIEEGVLLYPLNRINCLNTQYMIIVIDEESQYDPIELISRAQKKSFILSESEAVYNIINQIKGLHNETD